MIRSMRALALLFVLSCATTPTTSVAPAVTRPSDDAAAVLRSLDRLDGELNANEAGLNELEKKVDERLPAAVPPGTPKKGQSQKRD